jgi:hypothetical protein
MGAEEKIPGSTASVNAFRPISSRVLPEKERTLDSWTEEVSGRTVGSMTGVPVPLATLGDEHPARTRRLMPKAGSTNIKENAKRMGKSP